ncbi:dTDP-4-dehydrorhamnose reductase [Acidobacteria bacterium AB60]|nr:dTDP-4-dehydrorhamnose reductase [Acidobacteria bacterium AB60]
MSRLGRVLILGASGQVGRELQRTFADAAQLIPLDRRQADLSHPDALRTVVRDAAPDLILNAAAYTAVDRAESDRDAAFAINAEAPRILAEEARTRDILLVHYSTDYVFDGSKDSPWLETDPTNPLNVYGASKLAGERAITAVGGKHLIFRTSWVYGPHGKNFLLTMLRLGAERDRLTIVNDQTGAPTTSIALADATRTIVDSVSSGAAGTPPDYSGIYHMTCAGATTWYGFAQEIFARAGSLLPKTPEVAPINSDQYPTPARRPANSVLSNQKLAARFRVHLPKWEAALDASLAQLRP